MPKFKVVNPDAPEEIDFYQDIPLVDPDTGMDQLDSDGNILVKRYVNHTVSIKGINEVKDALPAIKTNTQNLEELYQYSHAQNEAQQIAINNNASAIVDLQTSTSEMALDLDTLTNKVNSIQGIDIDDLKDYVYTQVPLIKSSYLPLVGGTISGNLNIEEGTITGSLTGVASNATADVNNKELTSYVADIMGANAQLSIIKGDGTTSVISINNVLNASKATNADNATNLGGYPATDYIRSVNSITPDEQGNVQLDGLVKSVNGVNADASGNVTLALQGANFMPDYTTGVTYPITDNEQTLVVPYDCLLHFNGMGNHLGYCALYIDNAVLIKTTPYAATYDVACFYSGYVKKGSIVKYRSTTEWSNAITTNLLTLFKI